MVFYANGIPLSNYGMTQDGYGKYYYSNALGRYYQPKPADFYKPIPSEYTVYTNGSHAGLKHRAYDQLAVDLAIWAGVAITASEDVELVYGSLDSGSFISFSWGDHITYLVHVVGWGSGIIKAGQPIAYIQDQGGNSHLHIYDTINNEGQSSIYDIIIQTALPDVKAGDKLQFSANVNIRGIAGINNDSVMGTCAIGSVAEVVADAAGITTQEVDGFVWDNNRFLDIQGWMVRDYATVIDSSVAVTKSDGTIPSTEPVPEPEPIPEPIPKPEPIPPIDSNPFYDLIKFLFSSAMIEKILNNLIEVLSQYGSKRLLALVIYMCLVSASVYYKMTVDMIMYLYSTIAVCVYFICQTITDIVELRNDVKVPEKRQK